MSETVKVPNIGDFADVEVIDVLVSVGDLVEAEAPLITLESDKAAMDVPAPKAGRVAKLLLSKGDTVSEGSPILELETAGVAEGEPARKAEKSPARAEHREAVQPARPEAKRAVRHGREADLRCELLVLGSGPGGYTAAFRAADLGLDTVLVERYATLGGVCLNVGCIPSKALLHAAKVVADAAAMSEHGIRFAAPEFEFGALRRWKDGVVGRMSRGLEGLARRRKVRVVRGSGKFVSDQHLEVEHEGDSRVIRFEQCIIAAGSEAAMLPGLPDDPRIMTSTGALELEGDPETLLVVGGGIIGLEMATVYDALGVKVSVVELLKQLMPGTDPDLVQPLARRIEKRYQRILLGTKVRRIEAGTGGLRVHFEGDGAPGEPQTYDKVLIAVGRKPNGKAIGADKAGVAVDDQGFIRVDKQQRTNVEHIFAIGDIVGRPMLAHKASHEGKVAAEVAAGERRAFDARVIPSVAYTDPEIAWVGVTETEAEEKAIDYGKGSFPWAASGRSLALGRDEGLTKLLFDKGTGRLIGAGIVGTNAGDLISEVGLAIEMGADAADIGLTIHPHPTLSETVAFAPRRSKGR